MGGLEVEMLRHYSGNSRALNAFGNRWYLNTAAPTEDIRSRPYYYAQAGHTLGAAWNNN
jgi:hypothetical protein